MKYDLIAPRGMALSELLAEKLSFLGKRELSSLISDRRVKVSGVRTGSDVRLSEGDAVDPLADVTAPHPDVTASMERIQARKEQARRFGRHRRR